MIRLDESLESQSLKCPQCLVAVRGAWEIRHFATDGMSRWLVGSAGCPACGTRVVRLVKETARAGGTAVEAPPEVDIMVWPTATARPPVPSNVPKSLADDYNEAARVLPDDAKTSAALSRRCLRNLLLAKGGAGKKDLADQIDEVVKSGALSGHLADDLHAVRVIGNFAAHPIKSTNTGEIVEVEPGEAEWNLDVLEALFDWYYVEPDKRKKRRDNLNAKLKDAGKPPLPYY
jgi:Domain of unknown function (DUF4145)